jgi:hypothetical protein
MAANVRIVLNSPGIRQLLRSDEVEADLKRRADAVAQAAGDGHAASSAKGSNRARASVVTETFDAIRSESENHTLTAALDAGRG